MTTAAIDQGAIDELRALVRGEVLAPGELGFEQARTIWNAMIDRRPGLVLRCLGVADVVEGVNFARERGLALSIKGGGHNIAGLALADGALLLDMSKMRGVWVDREAGTAHAQAGCILGDVDRETQLFGLVAPLGFVSETGIAGLTLGGGFGYLTRRFGWTCDNVRSMQVVTAAGEIVTASETENEDLFWGLRGGGGNFGVVTSFEYSLYKVGPQVMAGAVAWPGESAAGVTELFRKVTAKAPPELTCVLVLRKAPPAPWLAKEVHGKDIAALFVCHSGSLGAGESLVEEIKDYGSPVGDILQPRSYVSQQSLLDATQPAGRRYYWKSDYIGNHDPEMLEIAVRQAKAAPSPHSAILIFPLDGALNTMPRDHSPAGNRDAKSVFNITGSWELPADDARNIAWARDSWEEMRRFSTGGTYVNFLTEEETGGRLQDAYGGHFGRLVEVKKKWDPSNLLHLNKNIPPEGV